MVRHEFTAVTQFRASTFFNFLSSYLASPPTMAEDGHISSAIIAVFAWYVPHVGMDMVEHLKSARIESSGEHKHVAAIRTTVIVHSVLAVTIGLAVLAATAVGVALSTQNLDDRMETILVGMSRIVAALMLCFVSYKFPKWCGLYPSLKGDARRDGQRGSSRTTASSTRPLSLRILAFNVRWSIWRHLGKQFFVLMPFYCGVQAMTIPVSMLIGSAGGALILLGVYVGATFFRRRHNILVPVFIAIGLAALSAIAFSSGCYYIGDAWGGTSASIFGSAKVLAYVSFAVWFLAILLVHSVMLKCSAGRIAATPATTKKEETPSPATSTSSNIVASAASAAPDKTSVFDETERTASDNEEECVEAVIEESAPVSESTFDDGTNSVSNAKEPTWCELVRGKLCCCAKSYDNRPRQSFFGRVTSAFKWVLWIAFSGFCLFVTIVNIGSTFQQQETSESLVTVQSTLYNNMNQGPVCAFDNRGANSTMQTFDNAQEANAQGFLVVHCGECAACSSWRNLKALWQSRQDVSDLSRQCSRRTLVPGARDEAIQCHMNSIGFDEACSACYVEDAVCTRNRCAFISLQSELIDHMASLPSDPDGADAADCNDAMCAGSFLPCGGANRRRMNIQLKSDESPPQSQLCQVVQVDWKDLFMDDFYVH
jgi:hypothetical protein